MSLWSKLFSKKPNEVEPNYQSRYDEVRRAFDASTTVHFSFSPPEVFRCLVESSLQGFKNSHLYHYDQLRLNQVFRTKLSKFKLTGYKMNRLYELTTTKESVCYTTTYQVLPLKKSGQCNLKTTQKVLHPRTIGGTPGGYAKFAFRLKSRQKAQHHQKLLLEMLAKKASD